MPGYAIRIVDEHGKDVADGEVGTLLAHGPSASPGYWSRPDATAATMFAPGWLRTGDSVRRDTDGFLHHEGRSDHLLKVSGIYVSPFEVESALLAHPEVAEAAVVGREDAQRLVKPCAFVVPREAARAGAALAQALKEHVKARLAPHKYPRWIEFRDALPKTATGPAPLPGPGQARRSRARLAQTRAAEQPEAPGGSARSSVGVRARALRRLRTDARR